MALIEWLQDRPGLLGALFAFSTVSFVGSLLAIPWVVPRMPVDAFVRHHALQPTWLRRSRALRITWRIVKNLLGVTLVLAGLAMLLLPGQGILTIFLGLFLIDGPGRRRIVVGLLGRPRALDALNWLRRRADREPFLPPQK